MSADHVTLAELAAEYEQSAENLTRMMRSRARKKADALRQGDRRAVWQFEADIADLEAQRQHTLEIAAILRNYYRKKEERTNDEK